MPRPWRLPEQIRIARDRLDAPRKLDGATVQQSSTRRMIFSCARLLTHLSHGVTLAPGDVLLTGSPASVRLARTRYLRPGDRMRLEIAGLGEQRQRVKRRTGADIYA
jgi:2,4-didehydro-3-deoxy-L-rhamnonate hydrolase